MLNRPPPPPPPPPPLTLPSCISRLHHHVHHGLATVVRTARAWLPVHRIRLEGSRSAMNSAPPAAQVLRRQHRSAAPLWERRRRWSAAFTLVAGKASRFAVGVLDPRTYVSPLPPPQTLRSDPRDELSTHMLLHFHCQSSSALPSAFPTIALHCLPVTLSPQEAGGMDLYASATESGWSYAPVHRTERPQSPLHTFRS